MKISLSLTADNGMQSKGILLNKIFTDINTVIQHNNYGDGILEYLIIFQIVNPPNGYKHIFKDFKPKFIKLKSRINRYTGEPLIIEKQFSYSVKITGEKYHKLIACTEEESNKIFASEILDSLSNFDDELKKVKEFDRNLFRKDLEQFFKEKNIL